MRSKIKVFLLFVLLLTLQVGYGQEKTVTGIVTDQNGGPVPAVNISVKGTTKGATTDFDGNYSIEVAQGATLHFNALGLAPKDVVVGDDTIINVVLEESNEALDEVVVTAFGRKLTRNESTSSVVSISAEELTKSKSLSIDESLQGAAPGVVVHQTSGTPGAKNEVRIRGLNSVTAGVDPLYVVNGMPINAGDISDGRNPSSTIDVLSLIDPQDIESISVLKDATAVAPYGAEGANGVILINTKSGKSGKTRYTFNTSLGFQRASLKGPRMLDAEGKYEVLKEGLWNTYGSGEFGNGRIQSRDQLDDLALEVIPTVQIWMDAGRPSTDWYKEVSRRNAVVNNVYFGLTQGTDKSKFGVSLGYNRTEGIMKGVDYNRWSGNLNYDVNLNERLRLNISALVANAHQDGIPETGEGDTNQNFDNPTGARFFMSPWAYPYNPDGSINIEDFNKLTLLDNPIYTQIHNIRSNDVVRALPTGRLEYQILENLTFTTMLGLDYTINYHKTYQNPIHGGQDTNGSDQESTNRLFHYTTQNSLDYSFKLDNHNFHLTALQEFSKYKNNLLEGSGENFPNNILNNLSGASANFNANSLFSDRMSTRYIGLFSYNYDTRYLVDATYSYQGDSRFSSKFRGFYSLGLGWNIHKEDFMLNSNAVDVLRLKYGYGITGNASIAINQYQTLLDFERYDGQPSAHVSGFGTDARWEKSARMDLSLDFGFFKNRLKGSVGGFYNVTSDMLFNVPLPFSLSFLGGSVVRNEGKMRNTGFELAVTGDLIRTPDFLWRLNGNLGTVHNKVTDLPKEAEITNARQIVHQGHRVFEWYLVQWADVDPDNGLARYYVDKTQSDELTYNYSEAKRNYIGKNMIPTYAGTLGTRFEYRDLFVEGSLFFEGGHKIFENRADHLQNTNAADIMTFNNSVLVYENAWRQPGDIAEFPRYDFNNSNVANAVQDSDHWLRSGQYMRLRDIGIGYTFKDQTFLDQIGLDRVSLSVRGTNLWTSMKDKRYEWDPAIISVNGLRSTRTPPVKSVTFNLNVNF